MQKTCTCGEKGSDLKYFDIIIFFILCIAFYHGYLLQVYNETFEEEDSFTQSGDLTDKKDKKSGRKTSESGSPSRRRDSKEKKEK